VNPKALSNLLSRMKSVREALVTNDDWRDDGEIADAANVLCALIINEPTGLRNAVLFGLFRVFCETLYALGYVRGQEAFSHMPHLKEDK